MEDLASSLTFSNVIYPRITVFFCSKLHFTIAFYHKIRQKHFWFYSVFYKLAVGSKT